jgi:hypothetical protein
MCGVLRHCLDKDHIHPRWKCKRDNWTKDQTEHESNIQFLCQNCHYDKTVEDVKGKEYSIEARNNISISNRNRVCSESAKIKISARHKGIPLSPEHKSKVSASLKGRTLSSEHKNNLRISALKRLAS